MKFITQISQNSIDIAARQKRNAQNIEKIYKKYTKFMANPFLHAQNEYCKEFDFSTYLFLNLFSGRFVIDFLAYIGSIVGLCSYHDNLFTKDTVNSIITNTQNAITPNMKIITGIDDHNNIWNKAIQDNSGRARGLHKSKNDYLIIVK
ncbi:MAG: hypothetical protein WBQ73_00465 [Candidatus Babeliales bacterium]